MRWLTLSVLFAVAAPSAAAVFEVTKTADTADGVCDYDRSLREAVIAANALDGPDVIRLPPGRYVFGLAGADEQAAATGDLDVLDDLIVVGSGAAETIVDANRLDRVFHLFSSMSFLELYGLTVTGGSVTGNGGGISAAGPLVVDRSVVSGNRGGNGGGILANRLTLRDSAVLDNQAEGLGGGVHTTGECSPAPGQPRLAGTSHIARSTIARNTARQSGGGLFGYGIDVNDSTISGNHAEGDGGGIFSVRSCDVMLHLTVVDNSSAHAGGGIFVAAVFDPPPGVMFQAISRSIFAGNTGITAPECGGSFESEGQNLFRSDPCAPLASDLAGTGDAPLDPQLGPLADNGGPSPTHAPLPGSPVIDAVAACGGVDQRGVARSVDGDADGHAGCDIGAVEVSPACLPSPGALCLGGGRFRVTARWQTGSGLAGVAGVRPLTGDTGALWFFDPANLELVVKALDGCAVNARRWFFASGLTDVAVEITVEDTATGQKRSYANPQGTAFSPRFDTAAFACN